MKNYPSLLDKIPYAERRPSQDFSGLGMEDIISGTNSYYTDNTEFDVMVNAFLHDATYTSKRKAIAKILYAVLNAAILALPYTVSETGVIIYIGAIIFFGLISGYTTCMVINMANEQKLRTLEDLSEKAFGSKGYYFTSICQIVYSVSLMCITLGVFGDIMSSVFTDYLQQIKYEFIASIRFQVIVGAVLMFPICTLTRSIVSLGFIPYLSLMAILVSIIGVVASFGTETASDTSVITISVLYPTENFWVASFVLPFCFSFNQKVMTVYSCLRRRSSSRWQYAMIRAIVAISLLYILFGVLGYLSSNYRRRDITSFNFFTTNDANTNSTFFNVIRTIVAVSLLLTLPVDCLVAATTWRRFLRRFIRSYQINNEISENFRRKRGSSMNGPQDDVRSISTFSADSKRPWYAWLTDKLYGINYRSTYRGFLDENLGNYDADEDQASESESVDMNDWDFDARNSYSNSNTPMSRGNQKHLSGNYVPPNYTHKNPISPLSNPSTPTVQKKLHRKASFESIDSVANSEDLMTKLTVKTDMDMYTSKPVDIHSLNNYDNGVSSARLEWNEARNNESSQSTIANIFDSCSGFLFWLLVLGICGGLLKATIYAAVIGVLATSVLVYIIPSMIYFRLGLFSDYQVIPVLGFIPNRVYMLLIQIFGLLLLLGNVFLMVYFSIKDFRFEL